jgi:hypothetical protein
MKAFSGSTLEVKGLAFSFTLISVPEAVSPGETIPVRVILASNKAPRYYPELA